jgi:hypothetical protein
MSDKIQFKCTYSVLQTKSAGYDVYTDIIAQGSLYADSYDDLQRSKQELKRNYTENCHTNECGVGYVDVEFTKNSLAFLKEVLTYEEYKTVELGGT